MGVKWEPTRGAGCVARALGKREERAQNTTVHMYENVTGEPTALCVNSNSHKNVCVLKTKGLLCL